MANEDVALLIQRVADIDREYLENVRALHSKMTRLLVAQQQATADLMALHKRVQALHLTMLSDQPVTEKVQRQVLRATTPCRGSSAPAGRDWL